MYESKGIVQEHLYVFVYSSPQRYHVGISGDNMYEDDRYHRVLVGGVSVVNYVFDHGILLFQ